MENKFSKFIKYLGFFKLMVRESYRRGMEKYDFSLLSISRMLILFFLPFTAYSLGFLPPFVIFLLVFPLFDFGNALHVFIFPFFVMAEFLLFIITESLVPAVFIKALNIKCEEGEYDLSIKDKNFFMLALHALLYRPPLMLLGIFKLLPIRMIFLRLAGLKVGKTALIPGTELIYDPYVTEIGEGTLLGGYVKIAGHLVEEKLVVKKVRIGNNCIIGADSLIFPGAVIEDDVIVGAKSLVTKDQVLQKGRIYGGIPAKEIGRKSK